MIASFSQEELFDVVPITDCIGRRRFPWVLNDFLSLSRYYTASTPPGYPAEPCSSVVALLPHCKDSVTISLNYAVPVLASRKEP